MIENLILFLILALLAEVLGTVGGFGSSLFFVPVASYFLDFYSVLGITAMFHVLSNLTKIAFFRKGFDKKLAVSLGLPSVIFVILGALLSKHIETALLELLLSVFLIAISIVFMINRNLVVKPNLSNTLTGGILSGFVAGLIGTGGAIRGITLAAYGLTTETFIATSAIIDLAIDSSRTFVYIFNGYVHYHDLYLLPLLLVVSIIGTYLGKRILTHMTQERFRIIVLALIFTIGAISIVKVSVSAFIM